VSLLRLFEPRLGRRVLRFRLPLDESLRKCLVGYGGSGSAVTGVAYFLARPAAKSGLDDDDGGAVSGDVEVRFDRTAGLVTVTFVDRSTRDAEPKLYNAIGQHIDVPVRPSLERGDAERCWVIDAAGLGRGMYIVDLRGSARSIPLVISP
jgi:hypothetical protein